MRAIASALMGHVVWVFDRGLDVREQGWLAVASSLPAIDGSGVRERRCFASFCDSRAYNTCDRGMRDGLRMPVGAWRKA